MKLQLLPIVFSFFIFTVYSQIPRSISEPTQYVNKFESNGYQGSVYNSVGFTESSITDENAGVYTGQVRYNIDADIIESKIGDELYKLKRDPKLYVRIKDENFYYCEFKTERMLLRKGYYVLVDLNDRYSIYKKYFLEIKDPEKSGGTTGSPTPGHIKVETAYFLEEGGIIKELPKDKKSALIAFKDKEDELKAYIKAEKIKLRKEEDLVRLVSRYNKLKSNNRGRSRSLLVNTY